MTAWRLPSMPFWKRKTQQRESVDPNSELYARVRPVASFVRLLHDRVFLEYSKKNHTVPLDTRIKIQKFVYIATQFFDLDLPYRYIEYIYGPHSLLLTNDYYDIEHIYDYDAITVAEWPRMHDFLDFVRYRDQDWLMIASTLAFTQSEKGLSGDDLIKYVEDRKAWHGIRPIHDELVKKGLLRAAETCQQCPGSFQTRIPDLSTHRHGVLPNP